MKTLEAKYKVGDSVIIINDQGVNCGKATITAVEDVLYSDMGFGYKVFPTDTPWFFIKQENLFEVK